MPVQSLKKRIKELTASAAEPHADPVVLHDEICKVIRKLEDHRDVVPAELHLVAAELEAEILEQLHDNFPV